MANRSNPNTPASHKSRAAAKIRQKRKHTKHVIAKSKVSKAKIDATAGTTTNASSSTVAALQPRGRIAESSQAIRRESGRWRREEELRKRVEKRLKKKNKMDTKVADREEKGEGRIEEEGDVTAMEVE